MTESKRQPFAVQAAKFSFWTPLVGIAANLVCRAGGSSSHALVVVQWVAVLLYVPALAMGIVALALMKKHGRKGVLVRAVGGVVINGGLLLLVATMIPALARSREFARNKKYLAMAGTFSVTPPPGFQEYPAGKDTASGVLYSFIKGDPTDDQPDIVLLVEDLGGTIANDDLSNLVAGMEGVKLVYETWKTHRLPIFEVREEFADIAILTYNAQIPVLPRAVQVKVVGVAEHESELRDVLRQALERVEGTSNW